MTRNYKYMPRNMTRKSRPKEQNLPKAAYFYILIFKRKTAPSATAPGAFLRLEIFTYRPYPSAAPAHQAASSARERLSCQRFQSAKYIRCICKTQR